MNLDRGFRRIAIAATVAYWIVGLPFAAYEAARALAGARNPLLTGPPVFIFALLIVAIPYVAAALALGVIRWIVRGFAVDHPAANK